MPISSDPIAATRIVATVLAPAGSPANFRMAGLTTMMYAIARNVVTPPMTSIRAVVPCSARRNIRGNYHGKELRVTQTEVLGCAQDDVGRLLDGRRAGRGAGEDAGAPLNSRTGSG